jgi:hypothetical protein
VLSVVVEVRIKSTHFKYVYAPALVEQTVNVVFVPEEHGETLVLCVAYATHSRTGFAA